MPEMDKQEFKKRWQELLDKDCKKQSATSLSRTLTDNEADKIGDHLHEWFENYHPLFDVEKLAMAMLRTMGKKDSVQDWAEAVIQKLKGGTK